MALWTKNQDDKLIQLATDGYSYGVIANVLGKSRNAIIGRASRLGLRRKVADQKKALAVKVRFPTFRKAKMKVIDSQITDGVTLMELQRHHCRWVNGVNDKGETTFCGAKNHKDTSYCEHHHSIVYLGRGK